MITPLLQREVEKEEPIQAKGDKGGTPPLSSVVESLILSQRGAGSPLTTGERSFFEPRFGRDLSQVRLHTDSQADSLTEMVQARAFTIGRDVFFGQGECSSGSSAGKGLLAHELTHVMQQNESAALLQRQCDPVALAGRTSPVFFPQETTIMDVFNGTRTLVRWASRRVAVGLVQQALVDLGYNLGAFGPRGDGVDRKFGPVTEGMGVTVYSFDGKRYLGGRVEYC